VNIIYKTYYVKAGILKVMAYVIVGLGNPGGEYEKTRHNAGRMAIEMIAKKNDFDGFELRKAAKSFVSEGNIDGEKVQLVLPEVYMNTSGKVMPSFVKSVKAAQKLLVIRDDLDLPLGVIKMTFGRGSGGHKGVESIMRAIKTKEFAQIKIGISGATPKGKTKKPSGEEKVIKHVIGKFSPKEEPILKKSLAKTAEAARLFVSEGIEKATMVANTH
jgi:PTH1 family peptidyl-tRNA hydrolase